MAKDETKTKEMVAALDILKKYVPDEGDSKILLWGDGLSVERANDAQRARLSSSSKLDEFIPVNADWHAQVILLQVQYISKSNTEKILLLTTNCSRPMLLNENIYYWHTLLESLPKT